MPRSVVVHYLDLHTKVQKIHIDLVRDAPNLIHADISNDNRLRCYIEQNLNDDGKPMKTDRQDVGVALLNPGEKIPVGWHFICVLPAEGGHPGFIYWKNAVAP